jgi:hypothetical protein
MKKSMKALVASAAIAGLLTGAVGKVNAATPVAGKAGSTQLEDKASCNGKNGCNGKKEKHSCKGKNSCKGKGGCKSGDNDCAGKNSCKGKGGCKTSESCSSKK